MVNKFNVKNFKDMMDLREKFAKNRDGERLGTIDHQGNTSIKVSTVKHGHRKETFGLQDGLNEKQHQRKMEQIRAVSRSKNQR